MANADIRAARYNNARRHEQGCWDLLVKHTVNCPACTARLRAEQQHGAGCVTGRSFRNDWIQAARRKYELSPKARGEDRKCNTSSVI